jgi:SHS2 domain-containing protein
VLGHDLEALLYRYLDELLYLFSVDGFCCVSVAVQLLDMNNFVLEALA